MPQKSFGPDPIARTPLPNRLRRKADGANRKPRSRRKEFKMRKVFEIGGVVAAAILIALRVGSVALSMNGRSTVRDSLKQEMIVGSPDMTPAAIKAEARKAGLTQLRRS
jgi:hypothetical protein